MRARVRSGGTWGSVFDATASDGLDINTLEVACDPGGDHVVLWGQAGTANTLQARRYDHMAHELFNEPDRARPLADLSDWLAARR